MEEEQPFASDGPTCSEAPGGMEPAMGQPTSADPAAMEPAVGQPASAGPAAMGAAVNQQANAPQFAYQNQPNVVNAMGVAMNQPTNNNAAQFVYQNQPTNNAPQFVYQNQPTNAPQFAYQTKPTLVTPMRVAVNQPANNAPQFAYQNQQQNVVNSMGIAMSQPANTPQYVYQNQQTVAANSMGVASSQQPQPANAPQIAYQNQPIAVNGQFSTGLMDCFADPSLFCMTIWFPCITFGRISEIVDQGASSCGTSGAIYGILMCTFLQFVYSWTYRQKMRMQYGMPEDTFGDLCIHCWCEPCSLTQEYRELQLRGYDLALGWHGNMARQNQLNQVVFVPPSVPGGMTR